MSLTNSETIYDKLCRVIPGGVNSPVRAFSGLRETPLVIDYAFKDQIYDVDKKSYIDFCASWGALILGHADKRIVDTLKDKVQKGTSFGITSDLERLFAEEVVSIIPSIDLLRLCSSGTEATMYATRLARGYTGRDLIVKFSGNYHGNADHFLLDAGSGLATFSQVASSKGVPTTAIQNTLNLPYNDVEYVYDVLNDPQYKERISAVIIEPVAGNMGVVLAAKNFLRMLFEETRKNGALLIFDEVITGFRVGLTGAQGYYGIEPDLTCFGKVIGGGLPIAAFGGKKEIMQYLAPLGPVYQAGTLSGNPIAVSAGLEVFKAVKKEGFYELLEKKANKLLKPIEEYIEKKDLNMCVQRIGSMFTLFFGLKKVDNFSDAKKLDRKLFNKFFNYLFDQGIYIPPSPFETSFIMEAHTEEHLEKVSDVILTFLKSV